MGFTIRRHKQSKVIDYKNNKQVYRVLGINIISSSKGMVTIRTSEGGAEVLIFDSDQRKSC